jgi:hypothetical protein
MICNVRLNVGQPFWQGAAVRGGKQLARRAQQREALVQQAADEQVYLLISRGWLRQLGGGFQDQQRPDPPD